jgi:threonine dehydrogenase-like Zn-dependent dehydrogenase
VLAAANAGASRVIIAGRSHRRLWAYDVARGFGASDVVYSDQTDLVAAVTEITDGELADRVIDTSSRSTQPVVDAVACARPEGTVVLAALKNTDVPGFNQDLVVARGLTVKGAIGVSSWGMEQAIRAVSSGAYDFGSYCTHSFGLDSLEHALHLLAGEVPGEEALHITILPT